MPDSRPNRPQDPDDPDVVVRRLLADARHDEPVPDDVAQRLDRVLAGLREQPGGLGIAGSAPADTDVAAIATLTDLDTRRHRRRIVTRLLLGAAAVLVVGVGVAQTVGGSDSPSADTASSVQRQSGSESSGDAAAGGTSSDPKNPAAQASPTGVSGFARLEPQLPVALRSGALDRGVRRALGLVAQLPPALQSARPLAAALGEPLAGWTCGTGTSTRAYGDGVLLPATYDGTAVVLAVRPASGDGRSPRVEVLACGSGDLIRASTVDPT